MNGLFLRLGSRAIGEPGAVRAIQPLYGAAEMAQVESLEPAEATTPTRRLTQSPPTLPAAPGDPHDPAPILSSPEPPSPLPPVEGSQPPSSRLPSDADQAGEVRRENSSSTDTAPEATPTRRAHTPAGDLPKVTGAGVGDTGLALNGDPHLSPPSRESWQQADATPTAPQQPGLSSPLEEPLPSQQRKAPAPPRWRVSAEPHELEVTVETLLPPANATENHANSQGSGLREPFSRTPLREPRPESSPTEVHVTIGRIEVTAVQESPNPSPRPRAERRKEMTLEQYLAGRRREGR